MLTSLLHLPQGVTAFIGSGGKTTLIGACAKELVRSGKKVIVCTTTHIYPFEGMPLLITEGQKTDSLARTLREMLARSGALCIGSEAEKGKLSQPSASVSLLSSLADHVLVEADGSAGHPIKAHAGYEPVIPEGTKKVICVFGLGGFFRPIKEVVHRPGLFIDRLLKAGFPAEALTPDTPLTPSMAACVFEAEKTGAGTIFLNQADLPGTGVMADEFIRALTRGPYHILAGSAFSGSVSIRTGN